MADPVSADLASLRIERGPRRRPTKGGDPEARTRWPLGLLVGVIVVGAAIYFAYPKVEAQLFKAEVSATHIAMISPLAADVSLTASGYVIPQTVSKVGAKLTGR